MNARNPYRAPELPSGARAEQRLRDRFDAVVREAARERQRRGRVRQRVRGALVGLAMSGAVYTVGGIAARALDLCEERWFNASLLLSAIGTPMALVFAVGLRVPPAGAGHGPPPPM